MKRRTILSLGAGVVAAPALGACGRQRQLSMVFQSYAIFPHMRVRQNVGFGLAMRKVPRG